MPVKLPLVNDQEHFVTGNCFRFYAFEELKDKDGNSEEQENAVASSYFMKGLISRHHAYWSENGSQEQRNLMEKAFSYFYQALAAKPNYFCARVGVQVLAEKLGFEEIAEDEKYALQMSNNPHPDYHCHLQHNGFFSASDLSRLEESLKERK